MFTFDKFVPVEPLDPGHGSSLGALAPQGDGRALVHRPQHSPALERLLRELVHHSNRSGLHCKCRQSLIVNCDIFLLSREERKLLLENGQVDKGHLKISSVIVNKWRRFASISRNVSKLKFIKFDWNICIGLFVHSNNGICV